jgi:hypothetical protein
MLFIHLKIQNSNMTSLYNLYKMDDMPPFSFKFQLSALKSLTIKHFNRYF